MGKDKETHTVTIDGDKVFSMYSEDPVFDVRRLGDLKRCEKVSDVKFDVDSQEWVAIDRKTGEVVARDKSRKGCVRKEHAHYEKEIAAGREPWRPGPAGK